MKKIVDILLLIAIILYLFSLYDNLICTNFVYGSEKQTESIKLDTKSNQPPFENKMSEKFQSKEKNTQLVFNIVLVGMIIVFASLSIIALIIKLFGYFKTKENPIEKSTKSISKKLISISQISKKLTSPPIDHNIKAAAITIIFLYENEVETQSKMLLTMKRTKASQWQQVSKLLMSNYVYWRNIKSRPTRYFKK
ncbi:MAG: OadG family protein [Candidatus Cloacimonadota bacterium]|nr:OadG family protein [Candidatus Cloacimonadota bacterium]